MSGAIRPLPQHTFMAWCSVKKNTETTFIFIRMVGEKNSPTVAHACRKRRLKWVLPRQALYVLSGGKKYHIITRHHNPEDHDSFTPICMITVSRVKEQSVS
jgi:hypothetical protein